MTQYQCFDVEIENYIAHIQFNRPAQMNSMTQAFWRELPQCVQSLDAQGDVRVIVISSTGKHFCSGMDLSVFSDPACVPMKGDTTRVAENLRRLVMQLQDSLSSLENVRIPVLTAIQGGCIGGALDMVCASDSRYCTADAYFTIKETQIGMTADLGTLQRLPKLIPQGIARELAYTGRDFGAQEALQFGLVNKVFETHEAMIEGVMSIATQMAKNSPLAVLGCKEMINYARDHSVADGLKYMATWQSGMFRQEELMKSFAAKAQKVEPTFDAVWPIKPLFK
jgi:enoyl-CoA hydratase